MKVKNKILAICTLLAFSITAASAQIANVQSRWSDGNFQFFNPATGSAILTIKPTEVDVDAATFSIPTATAEFPAISLKSTNKYTITPVNPAANRAIGFIDPGGAADIVLTAGSQTLTSKTLTSPTLGTSVVLKGSGATNAFTITPVDPAAGRAIGLQDPGAAADLVCTVGAQTLTSKTLTSPVLGTSAVLKGSGATNKFTVTPVDPAADRAIGLQDPGAAADLVCTKGSQTLESKTLTSPVLGTSAVLKGSGATNKFTITPVDPAADRAIGLQDPGAAADLVCTKGAQTLESKTLTSPVIGTSLVFDQTTADVTVTASNPGGARTVNIPDVTTTPSDFILSAGAQTKAGVLTLSDSPVLSTAAITANGDTLTLPDLGSTSFAYIAGSQTLTDKTLTSPILGTTAILQGAAATHKFTVTPVDPAADIALGLPDFGAACDLVATKGAQTLESKTLTSPILGTTAVLKGSGATNKFTVTPVDPAADRAIGLPDPGGAADLVMTAGSQTLTSKSLTSAVLGTTAVFQGAAATHKFTLTPVDPAADIALGMPDFGAACDLVATKGAQTLESKTLTSPIVGTSLVFDQATADYTITAADPGAGRAITLPDPGASASICLLTAGQTTAGQLKRADLTEEALVVHSVCFATDACELNGAALGTAASANKFGLSSTSVFGTPGVVKLVGETANSNTKTDTVAIYVKVPTGYIAGQALQLSVTVAMTGAGAAAAAPNSTIDANVSRIAGDGSVSADLCTQAAQAMTTAPTARVFTLNSTDLVPGDVLQIMLQMATVEGAAADATGEIDKVSVDFDIKG